jgi:hypothetical protein
MPSCVHDNNNLLNLKQMTGFKCFAMLLHAVRMPSCVNDNNNHVHHPCLHHLESIENNQYIENNHVHHPCLPLKATSGCFRDMFVFLNHHNNR